MVIGSILFLNLIIDPFNITGTNLLNIKYKYARDDRTEKIERIKQIESIQNLILGSSRAQHLDPKLMSKHFGGYTYNFGVGGGTTAEALGLLLYLESIDKLPKNVLLVLDFSSFGGDSYHPSFLKIPELNFLNQNVESSNQFAKFLSIDSLRASFKTLKAHIKGTSPKSYFNQEGLMISLQTHEVNDINKKIKELAHKYYILAYGNGNIKISQTKLNYLKDIIRVCHKHNTSLHVTLSPVYQDQLALIEKNPKLANQLREFKSDLSSITKFCDAMRDNKYTRDIKLFEDSVHYTKEYGDLYLQTIFGEITSNICLNQ